MQEKLKNLSLRIDTVDYRQQDRTKASHSFRRSRYSDAFSIPRFRHCKLRGASGLRTWRKRPSFNILGIA